MNKKILIGCIITVSILIGVSFTSVVGYESVDLDVNASPLFNIRASKILKRDNRELICRYIGKKNDINIFIPDKNNEIARIQKFIKIIQTMSNELYKQLVNFAILQIQKNDDYKEIKSVDIINELNTFRNYQEFIISNKSSISDINTFRFDFIPTICWFPGCAIVGLISFIFLIIIFATIDPCTSTTGGVGWLLR